jgi:hypothetical protein
MELISLVDNLSNDSLYQDNFEPAASQIQIHCHAVVSVQCQNITLTANHFSRTKKKIEQSACINVNCDVKYIVLPTRHVVYRLAVFPLDVTEVCLQLRVQGSVPYTAEYKQTQAGRQLDTHRKTNGYIPTTANVLCGRNGSIHTTERAGMCRQCSAALSQAT